MEWLFDYRGKVYESGEVKTTNAEKNENARYLTARYPSRHPINDSDPFLQNRQLLRLISLLNLRI